MSERALRLPGSYPDHDPEEFQNDPPQPRSRPTALHTPSSHRPASSRHRSSSNQPSIPHSRPGASRHESPRTQSSNGEDTPIIFVQEQSRPPPSHRTTSAPTASSRSNFIRSFRSMFTSKPMTEVPDSRVPTEHAPLVDNARTMADGFALPSHMQSVYHPTIARRSNSDPPIASRQSNLDPPSVARRSNHEPSAFPDSEHPSSRIQTEKAPLLDIERTHYEGMALPSHMKNVYPLTVAPSANSGASSNGRPSASSRPSTSRSPSNSTPSSDEGPRSNVEATSRPNSASRPRINNRPGSNGNPKSNGLPSMQMNGLVPIQENEQEDEDRSYPAHTALVSNPPAHASSVLRTPEDQRMASRQTQITTMRPQERSTQEQWAQSILQRVPHSCPQGHGWKRIENPPGYHCGMGGHCITDDLLAQGRGGICIVPGTKINKMLPLWGPYYEGPQRDGSLVHGGDPNQAAPSFIEAGGTYKFDKAWRLHPDLSGPPTKQSEVERINQEYDKIKGPRKRQLTLADFHGSGRYR